MSNSTNPATNTIKVLQDTEKALMTQLGYLTHQQEKLTEDINKVKQALKELGSSSQYLLKVEELTREEAKPGRNDRSSGNETNT